MSYPPRMVRLACLTTVLLAACGGATPPATPATSTTPPAQVTEPASLPPALDLARLGQPCVADGTCAAGSCVTYHGIAGPRGPAFTSCEVTCADGKGCPDGTACITVADGPGAVCRPPG